MSATLFLKTIAFDVNRNGFYSPSQDGFLWPKDIAIAQCVKCAKIGTIDPECACGLYGSPNPETLVEYHKFPNSIVVILAAFGRFVIHWGPRGLEQFYVVRARGARIVGIVLSDLVTGYNVQGQRIWSAIQAMNYYDVEGKNIETAKNMIRQSWLRWEKPFDPYIPYQV
jgi:hypothetical protein